MLYKYSVLAGKGVHSPSIVMVMVLLSAQSQLSL